MRNALMMLVILSSGLSAQVVVPPGFTTSVLPFGSESTGLVVAEGGAYGNALYATRSAQADRINPHTGMVTTLASGLATGNGRPSGVVIDKEGIFGSETMYVTQNNGSVITITPGGSVSGFSGGGVLYSCNDLRFAPAGSAFGPVLFVSNGDPGSGTIATVTASGSASIFSPASMYSDAPVALDFPPPGSAFGTNLFTTVFYAGELAEVDVTGQPTTFATGLGWSIDMVFNPRITTAFGDYAYVTDPMSDSILRVDPAGTVTTFATGFNFSPLGWDADITFTPDGATLYVSNGNDVTAIHAPCSPGTGQANRSEARLEINGYGTGTCPGPVEMPLFLPGDLTLRWSGPPGSPFILVAGPVSPVSLDLGCVGKLDVGTPPTWSDLIIVFDGLDPTLMPNPFVLDATGQLEQIVPVPTLPPGALTTLQGAILQPPGAPCFLALTAAFELVIQ